MIARACGMACRRLDFDAKDAVARRRYFQRNNAAGNGTAAGSQHVAVGVKLADGDAAGLGIVQLVNLRPSNGKPTRLRSVGRRVGSPFRIRWHVPMAFQPLSKLVRASPRGRGHLSGMNCDPGRLAWLTDQTLRVDFSTENLQTARVDVGYGGTDGHIQAWRFTRKVDSASCLRRANRAIIAARLVQRVALLFRHMRVGEDQSKIVRHGSCLTFLGDLGMWASINAHPYESRMIIRISLGVEKTRTIQPSRLCSGHQSCPHTCP